MNFYENKILPRFIDTVCGHKAFAPHRKKIVSQAVADQSRTDAETSAARVVQAQRSLETAEENLDKAASLLLPITSAQRRAHIIRHQADIAAELGLSSESFVHYEAALSIYRRDPLTNPMDLANALRGFALLKERWKEFQEAKKMWREAREIYTSFGIEEGVIECNAHLYP